MKKSEDRETVHNTVKPRMMIIAPEEENILLQVFSRITAKKGYISLGNIDPLQDLYIQPSDTDSFFLSRESPHPSRVHKCIPKFTLQDPTCNSILKLDAVTGRAHKRT